MGAINDSLKATQETLQSLRELQPSIEDVKANEERQTTEIKVHRWLDAYDINPTHHAALFAHMEGAGSWFINEIISDCMPTVSRLIGLRRILFLEDMSNGYLLLQTGKT